MDPMEIVDTVKECIVKGVEKLQELGISADEIKSVGIANQRETTVVWDSETGEPLHHAIVWLDTRTSQLAEETIAKTPSRSKDEFKVKTGLPIHPYFSALKLKWLLENVDEVKKASSEDINKRKWSCQLCEFFEIPPEILPQIRSSAEIFGFFLEGPLKGIPIAGCLGDQQAAMVGHNCLRRGDTKNTYGTGTFMLCNIGPNITISKNGLLTTVGFQFGPDSPVVFALEGSGSIGGNVVRFLRDNFNFIKDAREMEAICRTVDTTEDVFFVPCFTGLYTPYWDPTARGTILGMTQVTTKAHICLAALRAVAYQSAEMIEAVEQDLADTKIQTIRTDGGMTANVLFNQIQAEIIGKVIKTPKTTEISGWGAAVAGGIGAHHFSLDEFTSRDPPGNIYMPPTNEEGRLADVRRWKEAVSRARGWAQPTK
ncbi:putative glycerol kinase [Necator americanus]|uniref:glycerol kinase n=1 Tax=Necator americanus TaxID=51031 RepID=W2TAM9_NECAM|nr:putative glycerol kinase [Necator americanus]ETN79090.1 putative glycerol kinase [Necator americanus]